MSRAIAIACALAAVAATARAESQVGVQTDAPAADALDVRLTLSSFLYRESGGDPAPLVDQGANPGNASPVHRLFGDLRLELADAGFALDARVRQTTSARYQSGADGEGEYEVRTLAYRIGSPATHVTLGRQVIDAVGATKIDGLAFTQRLTGAADATVFAGLFPMLGSRSLDTDYIHLRNPDGTSGSWLLPVAGGAGVTYHAASIHGGVGVAGVYVPQDVPGATSDDKTRVFAASSGYWRPAAGLDVYHFALVDLAGGGGLTVTNGSAGLDARPSESLQLTVAVNHVSTDVLAIGARTLLSDPDPTAIGVVQNNLALIRIAQDMARAGVSVALAERRFEISVFAGVHLRPAVDVELADGTGTFHFPEERSADATLTILDRRSIAGTRLALSASASEPAASAANRSRATVLRLAVSKELAARGQIEADVMAEHVEDLGGGQACTTSLNPLACFGTATTNAGQAGVLASWRVGKEWLVIADTHAGYQAISSQRLAPMTSTVTWPGIVSVTGFVRLQWRYR